MHFHEHLYCRNVSVVLSWPGPVPKLLTSLSRNGSATNNGSISNHSVKKSYMNDVSCSFIGVHLPPLPPNKKDSVDVVSDIVSTQKKTVVPISIQSRIVILIITQKSKVVLILVHIHFRSLESIEVRKYSIIVIWFAFAFYSYISFFMEEKYK